MYALPPYHPPVFATQPNFILQSTRSQVNVIFKAFFLLEKQAQLEEFKRLEDEENLDFYYLDEAGFYLIHCVPYGWQNIGKYLTIKSRHSRRLNVLGIMNRSY